MLNPKGYEPDEITLRRVVDALLHSGLLREETHYSEASELAQDVLAIALSDHSQGEASAAPVPRPQAPQAA